MRLNPIYNYKKLNRKDSPDGRKYELADGQLVGSVTTILSKTKDMSHLVKWQQRIGKEKAQQITIESAGLGTGMHNYLEAFVLGNDLPVGNNHGRILGKRMANTIIEQGFCNVDEVWGIESQLHYENLWAGTTDLSGVYNGKPAIMDFKTSRKPKKREWIEDYFLQISLYIMAHNWMFDTNIERGVIFMVSRDCEFQTFIIEDTELEHYTLEAVKRVDKFYV